MRQAAGEAGEAQAETMRARAGGERVERGAGLAPSHLCLSSGGTEAFHLYSSENWRPSGHVPPSTAGRRARLPLDTAASSSSEDESCRCWVGGGGAAAAAALCSAKRSNARRSRSRSSGCGEVSASHTAAAYAATVAP